MKYKHLITTDKSLMQDPTIQKTAWIKAEINGKIYTARSVTELHKLMAADRKRKIN